MLQSAAREEKRGPCARHNSSEANEPPSSLSLSHSISLPLFRHMPPSSHPPSPPLPACRRFATVPRAATFVVFSTTSSTRRRRFLLVRVTAEARRRHFYRHSLFTARFNMLHRSLSLPSPSSLLFCGATLYMQPGLSFSTTRFSVSRCFASALKTKQKRNRKTNDNPLSF